MGWVLLGLNAPLPIFCSVLFKIGHFPSLQKLSHDTIQAVKQKTMSASHELLSRKPEQEKVTDCPTDALKKFDQIGCFELGKGIDVKRYGQSNIKLGKAFTLLWFDSTNQHRVPFPPCFPNMKHKSAQFLYGYSCQTAQNDTCGFVLFTTIMCYWMWSVPYCVIYSLPHCVAGCDLCWFGLVGQWKWTTLGSYCKNCCFSKLN